MVERCVEHGCAHEQQRVFDRAIDVRFRSEMKNPARPVLLQQPPYHAPIANIPMDESIPRVVGHALDGCARRRVGQGVEVDDTYAKVTDKVTHQRRANESTSSGDQRANHAEAYKGVKLVNEESSRSFS